MNVRDPRRPSIAAFAPFPEWRDDEASPEGMYRIAPWQDGVIEWLPYEGGRVLKAMPLEPRP